MREVDAPTRAAIEAVWRIEAARLIGGLVRLVRDVDRAEDLAQDALLTALSHWPETGIPPNPGAWLMTTAKNRATDEAEVMSNEKPVEATAGDVATGARAGRRGWTAAIAVAAVAAGLVAYKELRSPPGSSAAPTASASGGPVHAAGGSVLLFADPSEAETTCGCGQIIRLVRGASTRGVAVREIAPGSDTTLEREHRVTVAPTVLFLDESGREVARHEGEGRETVDAIRAGLDRIAKAGR